MLRVRLGLLKLHLRDFSPGVLGSRKAEAEPSGAKSLDVET